MNTFYSNPFAMLFPHNPFFFFSIIPKKKFSHIKIPHFSFLIITSFRGTRFNKRLNSIQQTFIHDHWPKAQWMKTKKNPQIWLIPTYTIGHAQIMMRYKEKNERDLGKKRWLYDYPSIDVAYKEDIILRYTKPMNRNINNLLKDFTFNKNRG